MTRERAIELLIACINELSEAADPDYLAEALEGVGLTEEEAYELGVEWVFDY